MSRFLSKLCRHSGDSLVPYGVAQRTYEIGVRAALGADSRRLLGLVLGQGMSLVALGLLIGLASSIGVGQLLRGLMHEVGPADPVAFAAMSGLLLFVAAAATLVPARRAARIDPIRALRSE
jgi:ABC-type antimicrobial peptide transport system permease subunit